jgi:hypothetical protein
MSGGFKDNLRVGKPDVKNDQPAHTPGVNQGNAPGNYEKQAGWGPEGKTTAEASTGINAKARNVIDPRMPFLPPG